MRKFDDVEEGAERRRLWLVFQNKNKNLQAYNTYFTEIKMD